MRIRNMQLRRLNELELQAAQFGPHTDPGILIEIQEIYNQFPQFRNRAGVDHARLDYDFLMNAVAAALQRLTLLEQSQESDKQRRRRRQLIQDLWMVAITTIAFVNLLLLLNR
ncbi:MAG: hypothetical protein IPP13_18810 [Kouleothrix sp.]|nr:hypothetical protein [Kouleothrix sp.]